MAHIVHDRDRMHKRRLASRAAVASLSIALALLAFAASAQAALEPVATFGETGEAQQLLRATSVAVNTTGAGGVPAGTVYIVGALNRVSIYGPRGDFRAAWGWGVSAGGQSGGYERCGPEGEAVHPTCSTTEAAPGEGVGQFILPVGVAVDQQTGDVYVLGNSANGSGGRKHDLVQVFSPDGSTVIGGFGDQGAPGETVIEGPQNIHNTSSSGLAVNTDGTVYVSDGQGGSCEGCRVMAFKPTIAGNYASYAYTGRANDIAATQGAVKYFPGQLALDNHGKLYVGGEEELFEFSAAQPGPPVCSYRVAGGGAEALTVNPETGEVFYFTYKNRKIHQLAACNSEGKFTELEKYEVTPRTEFVEALAFNETYSWEPGIRAPGVLYAIDGEEREGRRGLGHIYANAPGGIPPLIESESVSNVTSLSATLHAQINPKGSSTEYIFQYLPLAAYEANPSGEEFAGASSAPLVPGKLSGSASLSAAVTVSGLIPDTDYRFRVIVGPSGCDLRAGAPSCAVTGPAEPFRTYPAEAESLPDGRAYELVSPAEKHGGEVFPSEPSQGRCGRECKPGSVVQHFPMQASANGERVVYEGYPFSPTEGASAFNEYLSSRTSTGWQTTTLAPPLLGEGPPQGYDAFDSSLTQGMLYQAIAPLSPEAPSGYGNLYRQPTAFPGSLTPLLRTEPENRSTQRFHLSFAGASSDLSRVFFTANDALTGPTPFAPAAVDAGEANDNLYESFEGQLRLVNVLPGNATTTTGAAFGAANAHSVSNDGSRVYWSAENGQVYVRENAEVTEAIPDAGRFLAASADGSHVLLSDGFLYDLESSAGIDLSEGKGGFEGILGQSEDLSQIYFVDTAVLGSGLENEQNGTPQPNEENLYGWRGGQLSFIDTLAPGDNHTPGEGGGIGVGDWRASPSARSAEASPDGTWLAFLSEKKLTGYENVGPTCLFNSVNEFEPGPCFEAFAYNSDSGHLICISCNRSGARPTGRSIFASIQGAPDSLPQPRYVTDSGRIYFDSQDSLSPFDSNRGIEDVYQFEPIGTGNCARSSGCVSLVSSGHGAGDSNFLAVDSSGKNVFFTTREQLVPQDRDNLVDLYDAREEGGFPSEASSAPCRGEACQPSSGPPQEPSPSSEALSSASGGKPTTCKKGQIKKKGHCVKKARRANQHRHKKNNKKKPKEQRHHRRGRKSANGQGGSK
jgi:hypothetical protein